MEVQLVVLAGAKRGTRIRVAHRHFFIGRSDDCHLRPTSAAVSRHHCLLLTSPQAMVVCDLGSESGTFVNDRPVTGKCQLVAGDRLRVGPIDFQVEVSASRAALEQETLVQAAHPTTTTKAIGDSAVHDWLGLEGDTSRTVLGQDGRGQADSTPPDAIMLAADSPPATSPSTIISGSGAHKRVVGKLPPRPFIANTDSSQSAAGEMLEKLRKKKS